MKMFVQISAIILLSMVNVFAQESDVTKDKNILLSIGLKNSSGMDLISLEKREKIVKQKEKIYRSENGPKIKPVFISLPPGAVKPLGWLLDWAGAAANGITGHLDEWSPTFGEAWKGKGFKAPGAGPDGTGWPLEQCSYWLDGAVRLAYILNDSSLIKKTSERLDMVVDGVLNGGESFIYWKPKNILDNYFNNWAHSHMGRALTAYYAATGKVRVLKALVKVYSNYPLPELPDSFNNVTGAVNIDPMLETYLMSGEPGILEIIKNIEKKPSFSKVINEWRNGKIKNGHGVIYYENIRIPALLYPWTAKKEYLQTSQKCLQWLDENHLLPCGVASSEEHNAGVGSTRNIETCNVATSIWTYLSMFKIEGNYTYGDRIERIFFNAAPVTVSRDFQIMCYYQSPNRIEKIIPLEEPSNPGPGSYIYGPLGGTNVYCCVGNLNRIIPNYIMHMWMKTFDNGLAAILYGPSKLETIMGNEVPMIISCETNYPFEENITMKVEPAKNIHFPLYLRIPGWCKSPMIKINNRNIKVEKNDHGFVKLDRIWEKGDLVNIYFPMQIKVLKGHETSYPQTVYFKNFNRKIATLTNIHNPFESIFYGPLLFALPLADDGPNKMTAEPGSWQYALDIDPNQIAQQIEIIHYPMPEHWHWQLDAPVKLNVKTRHFDWKPTELQPLPDKPVVGGKPTISVLVPYGCTKFRVSMFPFVKHD